jgi:hypothetical protein
VSQGHIHGDQFILMKAVLSVGKDLQEDARQRQQNEDASITQYEPAET